MGVPMLEPNFKISIRKGKLKIKSKKDKISEEDIKKFETLKNTISTKYYNFLAESYLDTVDATKHTLENLIEPLTSDCLTKFIGDAYIIIENEVRYPPISLNLLGKKITLAFNGNNMTFSSNLSKILCAVSNKIDTSEGFTLKMLDALNFDKLAQILEKLNSEKLYEISILTGDLEFVEKVVENMKTLNYLIIGTGKEALFVIQSDIDYVSLILPKTGTKNMFINNVLSHKELIDKLWNLEFIEAKGNIPFEVFKQAVNMALDNDYNKLFLEEKEKFVIGTFESQKETKTIKFEKFDR